MSVVDYAAWKRGYMPPTEHVLIHELEQERGKVIFRTSVDQGSMNIVMVDCELTFEALEDIQWFIGRRILRMKRSAKAGEASSYVNKLLGKEDQPDQAVGGNSR
ncbi:MAG: hypothetical protein ACR2QC_04160 [Gammaproteobacteria bacterium]